jgi:elongation factor Tu
MLAIPVNRSADAEIILRLTSADAGGKTRSITSGYMPNVAIRDGYLTSAKIELLDASELAPGGECRANVWFITPEVYPNTLWPDRVLIVSEATHVVGDAIVLAVFNSVLLRNND